MHCELVVPSLFAGPTVRLPALELLLARARASHSDPQSLYAWLAEMFEVDEPLPSGALTAFAYGAPAMEGLWARADPVHLRLLRERVILMPPPAFDISSEEAQAFCEALNAHFDGVLTFHPLRPEQWCVRLEQALDIDASSPLEMAGRDVHAGTSRATGAGRLQTLMNEAQILLHAHPLNEAREARGEPTVNSVWLWGSGRLPAAAEGAWQAVIAEEPIALGLARRSGARALPVPPDGQAWLERAPEEGRYLVLLDSLRVPFALEDTAAYRENLETLEKRWFAPLVDALRSGRIGMVSVHVPDSGVSFEAIRGDLRRFWRRPKAIGHYA